MRNVYLGEAARGRRVHGGDDLRHIPLHDAPAALSQYDDGYLAARKVLLITRFLSVVTKTSNPAASASKQFAVFQFFPPTRTGFRDRVMVDQITRKSARGVPLSNKTSITGGGLELRRCARQIPEQL